jgi:hypothetical protein
MVWSTIANNHQSTNSNHLVQPIGHNRSPNEINPLNPDSDAPDCPTRPKPDWVRGYVQLIGDRVQNGWTCYMVTILFSQLPGSREVILHRMRDEVSRVYSMLVTDVHRKPRKASPDELPVFIGVFDLPVYKRARSSSPLTRCNDGLHFQALVFIPSFSRLKVSLVDYFHENQDLYVRPGKSIQRIHVEPVTYDHDGVVKYVFKTVMRRRIAYDDGVLVFPRARSELE